MTIATSIFVSRIRGLPMMDALGEQVGRVRDVVIQHRTKNRAPSVKGLIVELFGSRRILLPMERVHSIDPQQVIIQGVVDTRRYITRPRDIPVVDSLFDRVVRRKGFHDSFAIFDVAISQARPHEWEVTEVALRSGRARPFSRGHVTIVDWDQIPDLSTASEGVAEQLIASLEEMRPADVARELHDMDPERRQEVVQALDDDTLAEALEELPEDEQVAVIASLATERAADVLEEMDPDDAADLIAELEPSMAEAILDRMEPDEAQDVRTLLRYGAATAGGLMNPEPVTLAPDATVAEALALLRQEEVTPAMAALAFVCRPPLDTPTGRWLGAVHIQRLLREPPSALVATLMDPTIAPLRAESSVAKVSRYFATYDLVCAPVVDASGRLLGAVTVDDVLDHILPNDWRGIQLDGLEDEGRLP